MLLGKLAIGTLDRCSTGAPRHPQDLIGVAHTSRLLQGNQILNSGLLARFGFHLGCSWHFCNGSPAHDRPSALSPGLEGMNFPPALTGLAGCALQPAFPPDRK